MATPSGARHLHDLRYGRLPVTLRRYGDEAALLLEEQAQGPWKNMCVLISTSVVFVWVSQRTRSTLWRQVKAIELSAMMARLIPPFVGYKVSWLADRHICLFRWHSFSLGFLLSFELSHAIRNGCEGDLQHGTKAPLCCVHLWQQTHED